VSRCPVCRRRVWRGVIWHGAASNLKIVLTHKWCAVAAGNEFARGLDPQLGHGMDSE
jgi:hypothetical protein